MSEGFEDFYCFNSIYFKRLFIKFLANCVNELSLCFKSLLATGAPKSANSGDFISFTTPAKA
jgi:hypothetical protein